MPDYFKFNIIKSYFELFGFFENAVSSLSAFASIASRVEFFCLFFCPEEYLFGWF